MITWTVYERPSDFPYNYVARKFVVMPSGPVSTGEMRVATDLAQIHADMQGMGLARLNRVYGDEPHVVECWL
ncbi:MAG: hypothetical protein QM639_04850 [Rhodocyclaceae bacterium]